MLGYPPVCPPPVATNNWLLTLSLLGLNQGLLLNFGFVISCAKWHPGVAAGDRSAIHEHEWVRWGKILPCYHHQQVPCTGLEGGLGGGGSTASHSVAHGTQLDATDISFVLAFSVQTLQKAKVTALVLQCPIQPGPTEFHVRQQQTLRSGTWYEANPKRNYPPNKTQRCCRTPVAWPADKRFC